MQILAMTTASPTASRSATRPERPAWVGYGGRLGTGLTLGLIVAGMCLLVRLGQPQVAVLAVVALLLTLPLMHVMPHRLPPLNHLGTRNLVQVESETRVLVAFALAYPVLLAAVVVVARVIPASLIAGASSPLLSPLYIVVGKILLLGMPAVLLAARMGQLGRQLGLRRINTRWRWLGALVPFGLMTVVLAWGGAVGPLSMAPAAYILALPLAIVAVGFPEESFYRVLLQTRLELLFGTRSGIGLASLLYALMQIPVRFAVVSTIEPNLGRALLLSVGISLGFQAALGILYGYIWMRYRNAWVNVGAHSILEAVTLAGIIAH